MVVVGCVYVFMHSISERTVILHEALVSLSLSVSLLPENGSPGVTGILKGARTRKPGCCRASPEQRVMVTDRIMQTSDVSGWQMCETGQRF